MPALSALRVKTLEALAQQLRYSPKAAIHRVVERAERLVEVVEPGGMYPEDWLVRFLTGHRVEMSSPALLVGEALLREASAFVERITEEAGFTWEDVPAGAMTQRGLAARWGVSVRTLQRWRRQGLVAQRIKHAQGGASIVFSPQATARFQALRSDLSSRPQSQLLRTAQTLQRRSAADAQKGSAPSSECASFPRARVCASSRRSASGRWSEAERAQVHRLLAQGWSPHSVGAAMGVSPAAVCRADRLWRLALLRRWLRRDPATRGTTLDASSRLEAATALASLDRAIEEAQRLEPVLPGRVNTLGEFLERQAGAPWPPEEAREAALAQVHSRLVHRVQQVVEAASSVQPREAMLDACETALRLAWRARCELVESQTPAIWRTLASQGAILERPRREATAVHLRAMRAASAAAARASLRRGGRLAAPVSLALGRALARFLPQHASTPSGRARRAGVLEASVSDWRLRACAWAPALAPPAWVAQGLDALASTEREILAGRFGLAERAPATAGQRARRLGTSVAQLRVRERTALLQVWLDSGRS
ncbi:MAG: hypothetical protein D6824_02505 [Planctomycetota bacterium]|nr:MAG: hypothetical protein D6824_02505 [Planctomycetota bacterium]